MFNNFSSPPRKSCRLWHSVEKYCTASQAIDDNIKRRIRIACWILKATNTDSENVILIDLLLQQWLQERYSMLLYMFIACLGFKINTNIILLSVPWSSPIRAPRSDPPNPLLDHQNNIWEDANHEAAPNFSSLSLLLSS